MLLQQSYSGHDETRCEARRGTRRCGMDNQWRHDHEITYSKLETIGSGIRCGIRTALHRDRAGADLRGPEGPAVLDHPDAGNRPRAHALQAGDGSAGKEYG